MDIEQLAGSRLRNYEVESLLGRGGMGVVYKALQVNLDRHVALKILSPHLGPDASFVRRFMREARAIAKLDHSNIVQIHDIAEEEGLHFFSMQYVEGRTLDTILKEKGRLDVDEAIRIVIQAAQGIGHAHKNDIIHRDIKPSNIIVDNFGNVKVMDFGLARAADDRTKVTQSGALIGTLGYMSPEQCRGEQLDFRTDIYSLGVVLYEMLTGKDAFDADSIPALIHKIVYEEPYDVRSLNPDVPPGLSAVLSRAMAKHKEERYTSISEFLRDFGSFENLELGEHIPGNELRSTKPMTMPAREDAEELFADPETVKYGASISTESSSPSIAVLPFVNMSADPEQDYFCDGLAEELINALTHIQDLKVIARTSAFSFKGKNVNVRDIGRELDVGMILEGSVRKAGNKVRITAQLVDTVKGHHLWSERYDRPIDDIFAIQDEITLVIVDILKPTLMGGEKERLIKRQNVDLEAYRLYLKGRWFWDKLTEQGFLKAVEFFELAIKKDPDYAPAYAGLADTYCTLPLTYNVSV
jgi:serine/threonine protein kinase